MTAIKRRWQSHLQPGCIYKPRLEIEYANNMKVKPIKIVYPGNEVSRLPHQTYSQMIRFNVAARRRGLTTVT